MGMCSSDKYFKPKKGWCVMRLLVLESMILAVFMTGNILADELKSSYQDVVSQKEPQGAVEKLGYGTQQVKEKFVDVIKEGTDRVSGAVNSFDTGMVKAMGLVDKVARLREEEEEIKKMIAEGTIRMEVGLDLLDDIQLVIAETVKVAEEVVGYGDRVSAARKGLESKWKKGETFIDSKLKEWESLAKDDPRFNVLIEDLKSMVEHLRGLKDQLIKDLDEAITSASAIQKDIKLMYAYNDAVSFSKGQIVILRDLALLAEKVRIYREGLDSTVHAFKTVVDAVDACRENKMLAMMNHSDQEKKDKVKKKGKSSKTRKDAPQKNEKRVSNIGDSMDNTSLVDRVLLAGWNPSPLVKEANKSEERATPAPQTKQSNRSGGRVIPAPQTGFSSSKSKVIRPVEVPPVKDQPVKRFQFKYYTDEGIQETYPPPSSGAGEAESISFNNRITPVILPPMKQPVVPRRIEMVLGQGNERLFFGVPLNLDDDHSGDAIKVNVGWGKNGKRTKKDVKVPLNGYHDFRVVNGKTLRVYCLEHNMDNNRARIAVELIN